MWWHPIGDGKWVGHRASPTLATYTRGNAGEVYPNVWHPLSFSISAQMGEAAMRNAAAASGFLTAAELDAPPDVALASGVFGGYAYLNLSIQRLVTSRVPGASIDDVDEGYVGLSHGRPPVLPAETKRNLRATLRGLRWAWGILKVTDLPELAADQHAVDDMLASLPDPATASTDQLGALIHQSPQFLMDLFARHLDVSNCTGVAFGGLKNLCRDQLDDSGLAVRLLGGIGEIDSAAPSRDLWALGRRVAASPMLTEIFNAGSPWWDRLQAAAGEADVAGFLTEFAGFLGRHGSRGPNEWDTAFDTWETEPDLALALVDRMRGADESHDPTRMTKGLQAGRAALEADALARLSRFQRFFFRRFLASAELFSRARERQKTTIVRAIHGYRLRAKELDRRLVERSGGQRGDLWFVVKDEVDAYIADPCAFAGLIAERRRMYALLSEREPPFIFTGAQPPLEEWPLRSLRQELLEPLAVGESIEGIGGCPGVARGRACIVLDPADPGELGPGDVLVAPLTDPAWTPLFVPAEAVVVDVGALLSHAVIVSREFGLPCVVSAMDATRRIPHGALIEVDGNTGTVTVLELP